MNTLWSDKTWMSYGDSITEIGNKNAPDAWQTLVSKKLGFAKHYGRGVGGQKVIWGDSVFWADAEGACIGHPMFTPKQPEGTRPIKGCFCSWERITSTIPEALRNELDLIVVMGGTNDSGHHVPIGEATFRIGNDTDKEWTASPYNSFHGDFDLFTFSGALASTIVKLQAWCPNTLLVLATPISGRGKKENDKSVNRPQEEYNAIGLTTADYAKAVCQIGYAFSIPVIDVFATCGINSFNRASYIMDTVHPFNFDGTNAGNRMVARAVISGLLQIAPRE